MLQFGYYQFLLPQYLFDISVNKIPTLESDMPPRASALPRPVAGLPASVSGREYMNRADMEQRGTGD